MVSFSVPWHVANIKLKTHLAIHTSISACHFSGSFAEANTGWGKQNNCLWSSTLCWAASDFIKITGWLNFRISSSLQSASIFFLDIRHIMGVFKDGMLKPLTVWYIKAVVCKLSKCHHGGSSSFLMLFSRGTVMTGLKVFQHPYQCWSVDLMPFLPLFECSLCGYEHKSLFHPLNLHIFFHLCMM